MGQVLPVAVTPKASGIIGSTDQIPLALSMHETVRSIK